MSIFLFFGQNLKKQKEVFMKTTQVREFGKNMDEKETLYIEPKERTK